MKDIIQGIKKPEQFKISKFEDNKIIIEFYSEGKSHIPGYQIEANINSYSARRQSISLPAELSKAKYEGIANWNFYVHAHNIKVGHLYIVKKITQSTKDDYRVKEIKKIKLDKSYFTYNAIDGDIIIYLWGRRYEFKLSHENNYTTGFIDAATGEKASETTNKIAIKKPVQIIKSAPQISDGYYYKLIKEKNILDFTAKVKKDRAENKTQITDDKIIKIIEGHYKNKIITIDDGQYSWTEIKEAITDQLNTIH